MSTAAIVPSWTTAVNAAPGSSQPRNAGTMRRCAVLEIGRNSVSPCTTPSTIACNASTGRQGSDAPGALRHLDTARVEEELRLNRYLAASGHGSRRGVETLVTAGRVTVNGE